MLNKLMFPPSPVSERRGKASYVIAEAIEVLELKYALFMRLSRHYCPEKRMNKAYCYRKKYHITIFSL